MFVSYFANVKDGNSLKCQEFPSNHYTICTQALLIVFDCHDLQPGAWHLSYSQILCSLIYSISKRRCSVAQWDTRECSLDEEPVLAQVSPSIQCNRYIICFCFNCREATLFEEVDIILRADPLHSHSFFLTGGTNFGMFLSEPEHSSTYP